MLIVNKTQRLVTGVLSLDEPCDYCLKPLATYPLIVSDDATRAIYHVACALELATEILVDVFTFFSPPAPYPPLSMLTAPGTAVPVEEGAIHAVVNQHASD